jgi:hypothetical protein
LTSEYYYPKKNTKDGFYPYCIVCHKEDVKANYKKKRKQKIEYASARYYSKREEILRKQKERRDGAIEVYREKRNSYYKDNQPHIRELRKSKYHENPEKYRAEKRNDYILHKKEINERNKEYLYKRIKSDHQFRMFINLRRRMNTALKENYQRGKMIEMLGCSIKDLKSHLEARFLPEMSWDNYGRSGWHIDHRVPCASFDLSVPEQQKRCFHFTNLQPLWAFDNMSKGAKIL